MTLRPRWQSALYIASEDGSLLLSLLFLRNKRGSCGARRLLVWLQPLLQIDTVAAQLELTQIVLERIFYPCRMDLVYHRRSTRNAEPLQQPRCARQPGFMRFACFRNKHGHVGH